MSAERDTSATPAPQRLRLVVDFATGRILGARPPVPAPPAQPSGQGAEPPKREAA